MTKHFGLIALLAATAAYAGEPAATACPPAASPESCDPSTDTEGTTVSSRCAGEPRVKVTASQNTQSLRESAPATGDAATAGDAKRTALAIKTKGLPVQRTGSGAPGTAEASGKAVDCTAKSAK